MQTEKTQVLIIGGSLVGLSSALFLGLKNVKTIVVEKHQGSSAHPRAIGYTQRTMELFAEAGILDQIPQVSKDFRLKRAEIESLAGKWMEDTEWTPPTQKNIQEQKKEYSPYTGASLAQDKLEPILRMRATELGADLRYSTELISFAEDENGVTAIVRERNGKEYSMQAEYMIAADGSDSQVRKTLGIKRKGLGHLNTIRSVLFRAPLEEYLQTGIHQFQINQPGLKAFLTTYNDGRWVLMFNDDVEMNPEEQLATIYKAIGRLDIEVEIITTGRWELEALIAEKYSQGRVFITGDAAHTLPPTRGGFGANTGIHDAHNLAWKLAAVISKISSPRLLQTYSAERQPVAWERYLQTFARPDYAAYGNEETRATTILDDAAMEFGQLYQSSAIMKAKDNLLHARKPDEWAGQPGTRAPHLWVTANKKTISTLSYFQKGWVLLSGDDQWQQAANDAGKSTGISLKFLKLGKDFTAENEQAFLAAFGITSLGASLIRPDGFIAWRSLDMPISSSEILKDTLADLSSAVFKA
ncbi:putative polyketide hydroxylase [Pedobacter sp. UYP24]